MSTWKFQDTIGITYQFLTRFFGFQPNKKDLVSFYVLWNASKVEIIFFSSFETLLIKCR